MPIQTAFGGDDSPRVYILSDTSDATVRCLFRGFFRRFVPDGRNACSRTCVRQYESVAGEIPGLSKPGLKQSVRTYGFVRTLNLAGAPLYGLLDCFVVTVFR